MKSGTMKSRSILAIVLSFSLLFTGCTAQWLKVALADLPVLVQIALNIGGLVTTIQSGKPLSQSDINAIQAISAQAGKDLGLLQTLYNEYQASPNTTTLQKIQAAIADIQQNLPALLSAGHIVDPILASRVTAAVELVLTTVAAFAQLLPPPAQAGVKRFVLLRAITRPPSGKANVDVPGPGELKIRWNTNVCYGAAGCTIN